MAIAPTGAIYKALSFDGTSSRNYGVYITGEAVYNAPERDVEMITIPGRNGTFAMDKGRFENITVSYPASIAASTEADYRQALSDFRNFLCSKKGYVRLSDDYNPDEYRMAVYKSGLEVTTAQLRAGEFDIVFECKPQRFLTSGETAATVANNGTLTNPTAFDASPTLQVTGYGDITVNGYEIELVNSTVGAVTLADPTDSSSVTFSTALLASGDVITLEGFSKALRVRLNASSPSAEITGCTITAKNTSDFTFTTNTAEVIGKKERRRILEFDPIDTSGLLGSTKKYCRCTVAVGYKPTSSASTVTDSFDFDIWVQLTSVDSTTKKLAIGTSNSNSDANISLSVSTHTEAITAVSSQSLLGSPTYIDCDIGEAYKIVNGEEVPLNAFIDLGSKLPILSPGSNTFTYDNTVTQLKVAPNWWKI